MNRQTDLFVMSDSIYAYCSAELMVRRNQVNRPSKKCRGAFCFLDCFPQGHLCAFISSYPNIALNNDLDFLIRREAAMRGAYIAKAETADVDLIITPTGSKVQHALASAKTCTFPEPRVVSMPCTSVFERQSDDEYKESVLPSSCTKRGVSQKGCRRGLFRFLRSRRHRHEKQLGMSAENLSAEIASTN
jgi:transketolase